MTFQAKFVETYLRDRFFRPFIRKLHYIYFGLDHDEDIFVLSNTEDVEFKYCDSLQTTGFIRITNPDHLQALRDWFALFGVDRSQSVLFYFSTLMTFMNKISWDISKAKIRHGRDNLVFVSAEGIEEILISRPVDTYFTLMKLYSYLEKYQPVFFNKTIASFVVSAPITEKPNQLGRLLLTSDTLSNCDHTDRTYGDINLLVIPGQDTLIIKSLLQKDTVCENGIRIWAETQTCLNYGGYYTDPYISLCVVRDNVFLFPKVKMERVL